MGAGALALLIAGGPYLLVDCGCPPDPHWAVPTAIAGGISVGVGAIIGFTGLGLEIAGRKMVPRLDRQDAGKAQAGIPHVSIGATSVRVHWSF